MNAVANIKKLSDLVAHKKVTTDLKSDFDLATSEKGIEHAYWKAVESTFDTEISDDYTTDGMITVEYEDKKLFLLLEFKYKRDFTKRTKTIGVIIQTLFYIHRIREKIADVPNMIMIGDQDHAFVMKADVLYKYLDRTDIDWNIAPSEAKDKYKATLVVELYNDAEIKYYLHDIDDSFTFNDLVEDIKSLMSDDQRKIKLNQHSIGAAFDKFITGIVVQPDKYTAEELVNFFLTVVLNRDNVFINSSGNEISIEHYKIRIDKNSYDSFVGHFESQYRPSEKKIFTETSDRLIEDVSRRRSGEFYTPSAFVEYAYKRMDKEIGQGWENNYLVWDPAWGTGNLTRDRGFQTLYASTLHKTDLALGEQYNKANAKGKFQFDFLNDDMGFGLEALLEQENEKIPDQLADTLVHQPNTKILFFMNPPYATAGNANSKVKRSKSNISKTLISTMMRDEHYKVQDQLYAQFLYRILRMKRALTLDNVYIALFSPSLFLTGTKYDNFREEFLKDFQFVDGNIFEASNFADVSSGWAIDFTIWKAIKQSESKPTDHFEHNVLSMDDQGEVVIIDHKTLWNTDNSQSLQQFLIANTDEPENSKREILQFKSRYQSSGQTITVPVNSIGILVNDTNNVEASAKGSYIMSSPITRHLKTAMITENTILKQMVVFAVRNVVIPTWINQKDEFFAPDVGEMGYKDLERKSLIFSIFSPANNVISYRSNYKNANVINHNQWAFVDSKTIRDLADDSHNDDLYSDATQYSNEPFVYKYIQSHTDEFTDIEKNVINKAKQIVEKTVKYRKMMDEENPEFSLNTWDASWNQVTQIAKEFLPNELIAFNKDFSKLTSNILDDVYALKILRY